MTIQQAFNNAILNGWRSDFKKTVDNLATNDNYHGHSAISNYEMCLDPEFWKALGKSMGWKTEGESTKNGKIYMGTKYNLLVEWQFRFIEFAEHLAEGNSIESYFETLT